MDIINRKQLFLASRIALIVTAMTFAFRTSLAPVWGSQFHLNNEQVGWIFSPAFWGFTLAMIFGGPLCDIIGMKRLLGFAFIGHVAGIVMYLVATDATMLFIGTVCIGVGNGMVEAACNPLTVTLFPENKTTMLNRFHVWFPGGNVIGGLLAYIMIDKMHLDWRILIATLLVPAVIYGYMFLKLKFPQTERVTSGLSTKQMFAACIQPLFIIMVICMFLTGATELGTTTWLGALLQGANVSFILVFVFINGLMAVGRSFAGPIVHRVNPNGMLIFSSLFAGIGLILLSMVSGPAAFAAAFVFAIGVCFFWPTMLGFVSEYLPNTGALGLSIMGGAGMFSVSLVVPFMGHWYDNFKTAAINSGATEAAADAAAGSSTFLRVAIMPAILLVVFIIIYFSRKNFYKNHHDSKAAARGAAEAIA